ncbi:4-alpha-glucanotransferase [Nocardioides guangzhouensis]|uniref:4-alpha-glucanotransferase n=1 Tax=Nocardioides guangzhouensis TaxID=2497878 RepID=A0A4V1XZC3_9ACTN|nr:4-alpha-glucanotransferase [Nocardioides guangzhouensis]RYP86249.1 4-alpha-glucanotransferase [Nocardioides guangzhouensis]
MSEPGRASDVRRAGVLLHVTSLPAAPDRETGDLGDEAYRFVDFLAATGCSVWQVLPLVPTHEESRSPYDAPSAMAGNPALISREHQAAHGLGDRTALDDRQREAFAAWCDEHADWLDPYAEFTALRERNDHARWTTWEPDLRDRDPDAVREALGPLEDRLRDLRFEQWVFAVQWARLREYAASKGLLLFGDLPIFVSLDSADVWASRGLFQLDQEGRPTTVTGCPPDYFAAEGQRWNNPHYDWDAMAADGFAWWRRRIARQRELFDLVRIDHFRGFEAAWHVPADAPTARDGWWVRAPGTEVLTALVDTAGPGTLVAEDLGVITPEVEELRDRFGLPGMKVLQFAFDGNPDNPYLPHRHGEQSVVYTGTHDNDTTVGWWSQLDDHTRDRVRSCLVDPGEAMPWALVRLALASTARLTVVPAQDLLGLGSEGRMNTPGTGLGNWRWQAPAGAFDHDLAARVRTLVAEADRLA